MSRRMRLLVLPLCCLLLDVAVSAQEPEQPPPASSDQSAKDLDLILTPNVKTRVRLALPAMTQTGMTAAGKEAASVLEKTLVADLEYSGAFDVQDREVLAVLELTGDREKDFPMYRSLGNQMILLAEVSEQSGRLIIEA